MATADITFIYTNLSVGGGIFIPENYAELRKRYGITHIINGQAEYDDAPIARYYGIESCWCPSWDDYTEPLTSSFKKAVKFVENSILKDDNAKLHCHCAGGVHRGPMFALLAAMRMGVSYSAAIKQIEQRRLIADFPKTYAGAVKRFMENYAVAEFMKSKKNRV